MFGGAQNGGNSNFATSDHISFFCKLPHLRPEYTYKWSAVCPIAGSHLSWTWKKPGYGTAHKGSQLKHIMAGKKRQTSCHPPNCKLKSPLCLVKGSVYLITCNQCGSSYIGSSWRHLHTRYYEHVTQRASPIYVHNTQCNGPIGAKVLSTDRNIQRMRIKEALAIKR